MQDETSGYHLLLKRMKSHPHEFVGPGNVWQEEILQIRTGATFLTSEEKHHFECELGKLQEDRFNQTVRKKLLLREKHADIND